MLIDSLVSFAVSPLSIVAGAGVATPSGVIDLLGLGVGVDPANSVIIGTRANFGQDPGIGWPRLQAQIMVSTAFATGSAATMNFKYQAAEENTTTHQPGTWQTIIESGEIAVTDMDAIGDIVWQFDFEPVHPLVDFDPRFLRVLCQPLAATSFTAGAIMIPVTTGLDQQRQRMQPKNYVVGAP